MAQPITPDYGQQFLFSPALEDWVSADHPARFLREFVDPLDLPALCRWVLSLGHCAAVSVRNMISNVLNMIKNVLFMYIYVLKLADFC